ncbi:MAG: cell division protein FtsA [Clostridiaceae bacterium]|nr:cell division protein FtsA [Clostridiaceae bacterium]
MDNIVSCVDIGSSKVCVIVAKIDASKDMEIIAKAMEQCSGVKKGVIVDIDSTANAIKACVNKIRALVNLEIESAYVNIMSAHVNIIPNKSSMNISSQNREISEEDVENILCEVEKVELAEDRQIIDVIPRQYIIDGCDEITDPVGMSGVKLEVEADIISGKITSVQNIIKSMERANLKVEGFVVEALAASEIALTPEEKELGVVLIDVGGGITNVSVIKNKVLVFYESIPVGGDHITNDISLGLKIPQSEAEKLKREYELALTSLIKNDHEITVNEINESMKKNIKVSEVIEIIEARVFEIFSLCREMLERTGNFDGLSGGIVLAGGGISYIDGNMQLAYEVFDIPVRIASHKTLGISKPEFLISVGTAKYISNRIKIGNDSEGTKSLKPKKSNIGQGIIKKIASLFSGLF